MFVLIYNGSDKSKEPLFVEGPFADRIEAMDYAGKAWEGDIEDEHFYLKPILSPMKKAYA